MPKLNISKKIVINAPLEKVYSVLSNFNKWQPWSPWLIAEPDAKVTVDDDGKAYAWEGNRVGSGKMLIIEERGNYISYDLVFLKPWKSKAKTAFLLKENKGKTEVEWQMNSNWPFFLFFMRKQMEGYIGMDYERGLKMLKEYVEFGKVESNLEFFTNQDYEGCSYIGITTKTKIDDINTSITKDFDKLYNWAESHNISILDHPFSQYHKWDVVKQEVHYTAAIPVSTNVNNIPQGCKKGVLPKLKLHTVRHIGPYHHVGNAWSTIMMMQRNKEFKSKKDIHPLEFYKNDPSKTKPKDLITDVSFAIK